MLLSLIPVKAFFKSALFTTTNGATFFCSKFTSRRETLLETKTLAYQEMEQRQ